MTCPEPSTPSQRSCSPSPLSWKRSDVEALVAVLDDARSTLRRVSVVEGIRDSGRLAREAGYALDDATAACHALLRAV